MSICHACGRCSIDQFWKCANCDRQFDGNDLPDNRRCDKCGHLLEEGYGCYNPAACEVVLEEEDKNRNWATRPTEEEVDNPSADGRYREE